MTSQGLNNALLKSRAYAVSGLGMLFCVHALYMIKTKDAYAAFAD